MTAPDGGRRLLAFAPGVFAFGVAGIMLLAAAMDGAHTLEVRTRWPQVSATIGHCSVVQRRRPRRTTFVYFAECSVTFPSGKETVHGGFESLAAYYEHRPVAWGNPGIDELRAWVAQHPDGSLITVRDDPSWPPSVELDPPPAIFDRSSAAMPLKIAGIAAIVGVVLIGIALAFRSKPGSDLRPDGVS